MDFTADGRFLMVNSSGMDMVVVNAETCKKASPKDMKALRCDQPTYGILSHGVACLSAFGRSNWWLGGGVGGEST